jgi:hypothetical protein
MRPLQDSSPESQCGDAHNEEHTNRVAAMIARQACLEYLRRGRAIANAVKGGGGGASEATASAACIVADLSHTCFSQRGERYFSTPFHPAAEW